LINSIILESNVEKISATLTRGLLVDSPVKSKCQKCGREIQSFKATPTKWLAYAPYICGPCQIIEKEEEKHKKELYEISRKDYNRKHYARIAIARGMPRKFANISKTSFNKSQLSALNKICYNLCKFNPKNGMNYIIFGETGHGKSTAAAYIFCRTIYDLYDMNKDNAKRFSWVSFVDLLNILKKFETPENSILAHGCFYPKIFVMEFSDVFSEGAGKGTVYSDYEKNIMHKTIDYRWKNNKTTILVANLATDKIEQEMKIRFDSATVGRMLQSSMLIKWTGDGVDHRIIDFRKKSQTTFMEL